MIGRVTDENKKLGVFLLIETKFLERDIFGKVFFFSFRGRKLTKAESLCALKTYQRDMPKQVKSCHLSQNGFLMWMSRFGSVKFEWSLSIVGNVTELGHYKGKAWVVTLFSYMTLAKVAYFRSSYL